jgi:uncharacterized coiled-coil protein SlyX
MKGFSGFKGSPAKQEGPLPKENPKLRKSEMEGTWVYKGKDLSERAIDLDDRAGFIEEDIAHDGKATEQQKKDIKFLDRERDIIMKRMKNINKSKKKKSPAKQTKFPHSTGARKIRKKRFIKKVEKAIKSMPSKLDDTSKYMSDPKDPNVMPLSPKKK